MNIEFEPWRYHPWNASQQVELISVDLLLNFCHPSPTTETDLYNGEVCDQEIVWKNIMEEGMYEPLMLRINPYLSEIRLESGNHRVRLAKKYGVTHLPVASFITHRTVFHYGNGPHVFYLAEKYTPKDIIKCAYDYQIQISEHIEYIKNNYLFSKENQ
jgi:hypothetical protein